MVHKKLIEPEMLAEARRLYEQTLAPVADIAAMLGCSEGLFHKIARREGWRNRRARVRTFEFARALTGSTVTVIAPPAAEPSSGEIATNTAQSDPISPQQRAAIAQRIMSAAERALDMIPNIIEKIIPGNAMEAEHGARALASIIRMLRELTAFNQPNELTPSNEANHDTIPRDIDAFREALACRIRGFIEIERRGEGEADAQII